MGDQIMPTVRITTDWGHAGRMEWAGAPRIGPDNQIERSIDIPEEAYARIESAIGGGHLEGEIHLKTGNRFHWFLDR
jgi:hypothetical protein